MMMIVTALLVPRTANLQKSVVIKTVTALIMCFSTFLGGCGGGSSASNSSVLTTSAAALTSTPSTVLFDSMPDFTNAENTAFAIDVATGQIITFDDERAIQRFLNKQPDPLSHILFPSDRLSHVSISHLSHQLDALTQSGDRTGLSLSDVNQADPGHFLIFGKANQAPNQPLHYQMHSQYFCSHCVTRLGSATGTVQFSPAHRTALLSLDNDEISLRLPFHLTDDSLTLDADLSEITFSKNGVLQQITRATSTGQFFGPNHENIGMVYALQQQEGLISGGAVGYRP